MQITASGLVLALLCGLLGVWLFLTMSAQQSRDYRVQEAHVACDKANFDLEFAGKNATTEQIQRQVRACGEFDQQTAKRLVAEQQSDKEKAELKGSIEQAITSKNGEASTSEIAVQKAASAVTATMKN